MARFATISEIESTEIVICRLKSIITEYYFREILKRDLKGDFISYTKREILQVIQREKLYKLYEESQTVNCGTK